MALILCIETGTDICSVGISRDGEIISIRESDAGRDHAKKVGVFVNELLRHCNIHPSDLDAVAVGMGPGSYTGLRIGVSFAKGLCYGLNIPLIAISSLRALTQVAIEDFEAGILDIETLEGTLLCPMVDARRMEVYTQLFTPSMEERCEVRAEIVTPESFSECRPDGEKLIIFGNGARKCEEIIPNVEYCDIVPSVRGMASIAEEKFQNKDFSDVAYFEPFYLKDFIVTTSKKKLF